MKPVAASIAKLFKKLPVLMLETLAVIAVLVILAGGAILWRLSSGPIGLDFAREYIESALNDSGTGLSLTVEHVALEWPGVSKPLILGLKDVRVIEAGDKDIVSIDELGLSFSLTAFMVGKVRPQAAYMHKPSLRLVRTPSGVRLGSGDFLAAGSDEDAPGLAAILEAVRSWARGQAQQSGVLEELGLVEIEEAAVMVEDHVVGLSWFLPNSNFSISRNEGGAEARASVEIPGGLETARLEASVHYLLKDDAFRAQLVAENVDPEFLSRKFESLGFLGGHEVVISARIDAAFDSALNPQDVRLAALSEHGKLSLPDLYDAPLAYDAVRLAASYDAATGTVALQQLAADLGGVSLTASTSFVYRPGEPLTMPLRLETAQVPVDTLPALFPPALADTGAYRWLVERMDGGVFRDVVASATFALQPDFRTFDIDKGLIAFGFEGVAVDYRAPMMPAEKSTGTGVVDFDADTLVVEGAAELGGIKASEVKVAFDGLMVAGAGSVDIAAKLNGPFPTILEYLAREPIGYGKDLGIEPKKTKGNASLKVKVAFPTTKDLKKEEVKVAASGTVNDVLLPGIVDGLDLKGGPFAVEVREEDFLVSGSGQLAGRNVTFDWQQYFDSEGKSYSSRIKASIGADKALREHFGVELDDYISGTLPVDLAYTIRASGRNTIDISADLTPVLLTFEPLDFVKPANVTGKGSLNVVLDRGTLVEVNQLALESQGLELVNGRLRFGMVKGARDVSSAAIDRLRMGENDFALELKRDSAGLMKMQVSGRTVDARPFIGGNGKAEEEAAAPPPEEPPMIISVDTLVMLTGEGERVRDAKLYVATDEAGDITQLEMDALAGQGQIYLRYKPDAQTGRKEFRLEASDAGAALRAFGINKDVRGGQLKVFGQPSGFSIRGGDIAGKAELTNFTVVNAPGLARLLSAMSLPGLVQLLNNDGVVFAKLEANFDWFYRPQGAVLVLREGRTSGNSLGLTFDGVVDRATGKIDLSGTIVPLSMVNSLIGGIPVLGDILAGGAGGAVFAATYTVKGPLKDPNISVNPLAALAPGILRRILFEGG